MVLSSCSGQAQACHMATVFQESKNSHCKASWHLHLKFTLLSHPIGQSNLHTCQDSRGGEIDFSFCWMELQIIFLSLFSVYHNCKMNSMSTGNASLLYTSIKFFFPHQARSWCNGIDKRSLSVALLTFEVRYFFIVKGCPYIVGYLAAFLSSTH